jgi:hypothetical protein
VFSNATVKDILETAIDSLVDNFTREPYIHRCEHSIHCELYTMLTVHRALQGLYPLRGDENCSTTLIHKEWPETTARPEKSGRRGNFDMAILDPGEVPKHSIADFSTGRIRPAFVIEMGLNYGLNHLVSDEAKLTNSGCRNGYLVHLWQPHKGIRAADVKSLIEWCEGKTNVAVAVFTHDAVLVKHLREQTPRLMNSGDTILNSSYSID